MLCLIPQVRENVLKNSQNHHHIQVNTVIKSFFDASTEKELHATLDTFWIKYTNVINKNDPFGSNEFIWIIKYICDGNSHLWNHKYSLPSTKVIGFVACRVTSKA